MSSEIARELFGLKMELRTLNKILLKHFGEDKEAEKPGEKDDKLQIGKNNGGEL